SIRKPDTIKGYKWQNVRNATRRSGTTVYYRLGRSAAFKLLSTPPEGRCTKGTNPSFKTGIGDAVVAEASGSTSKQTTQPIAKRLRSGKGKEVSEASRQRKKRKALSPQQPYMTQNASPYSIVSDLLNVKANITLGQLMAIPRIKI